MDLVAEYAMTYGGPPRPDDGWHVVLALMRRMARFDARALYRMIAGPQLAISTTLVQGDSSTQFAIDRLRRQAYGQAAEPQFALIQSTRGTDGG